MSGSFFVSPCLPECYLLRETKIEPDLTLSIFLSAHLSTKRKEYYKVFSFRSQPEIEQSKYCKKKNCDKCSKMHLVSEFPLFVIPFQCVVMYFLLRITV